jgi:hypothetical protein
MLDFCFIDEVGLSIGDKTQPYMALGMLKVRDVSAFTTALYKFHYSYQAFNLTERKKLINSLTDNPQPLKMNQLNQLFLNSRHHEFKYDAIGFPNLQKYKDLIDLIKGFEFEFHCIVIDKFSKEFDLSKYGNFWQAYCKFLTLLLKHNCPDQQVIPILDFLHKSNKDEDIETILNRLGCVANAIQADSRSFPLLQICDILLGAVVFAKKKEYGLFSKISNKVKARNEFEKHFKTAFQINSLVDNDGVKKAIKKFNIWNFEPKKN